MLQSFYFAKERYIIRCNFFSSNMSDPSFSSHILLYIVLFIQMVYVSYMWLFLFSKSIKVDICIFNAHGIRFLRY